MQQIPPLASLKWSNEKAVVNTVGSSAVAGVARTWLYTATGCRSGLRICARGRLLKPFPGLDVAAMPGKFEITVVLLLDELLSQANKSHLRDANGFKEPEKPAFALSPVSRGRFAGLRDWATRPGQEMNLVVRGYKYARRMGVLHS